MRRAAESLQDLRYERYLIPESKNVLRGTVFLPDADKNNYGTNKIKS